MSRKCKTKSCFLIICAFLFACYFGLHIQVCATDVVNRYLDHYSNRAFPDYFVGVTTEDDICVIFVTKINATIRSDVAEICQSDRFRLQITDYSMDDLEAFQLAVLADKDALCIDGSTFDFYNSGVVFYVSALPPEVNSLSELEALICKKYANYAPANNTKCMYSPWAKEGQELAEAENPTKKAAATNGWAGLSIFSILIVVFALCIFIRKRNR